MAASTNDNKASGLDRFPVFIQGLIGVGSLALITVVGFFVFFAFDILLLDFDPIGKLVQLIF